MVPADVLKSWTSLNQFIASATEQESWDLLMIEITNAARYGFMRRIHSRYNKLRGLREQSELKLKAKNNYKYK